LGKNIGWHNQLPHRVTLTLTPPKRYWPYFGLTVILTYDLSTSNLIGASPSPSGEIATSGLYDIVLKNLSSTDARTRGRTTRKHSAVGRRRLIDEINRKPAKTTNLKKHSEFVQPTVGEIRTVNTEMGGLRLSVCQCVSVHVRLRAISRSHFLINFHQNCHRRKNPQK